MKVVKINRWGNFVLRWEPFASLSDIQWTSGKKCYLFATGDITDFNRLLFLGLSGGLCADVIEVFDWKREIRSRRFKPLHNFWTFWEIFESFLLNFLLFLLKFLFFTSLHHSFPLKPARSSNYLKPNPSKAYPEKVQSNSQFSPIKLSHQKLNRDWRNNEPKKKP